MSFCCQSSLSGIGSREHCDVVRDERSFTVPADLAACRLMHLGATDYKADAWLDGQYLGGHEGGYTPLPSM